MKTKKWKLVLAVVALFVGFVTVSSQSNQVEAARYGRGKQVTVPKAYRGTWYSYDRGVDLKKVRFTAHTMNGKRIYKQNSKEVGKLVTLSFTSKKKSKQAYKATKNWYSGKFSKFKGKKYLEVNPWLTYETWHLFRPETVSYRGRRIKILAYTNRYNGGNLYKSKAQAKHLKNHKFRGVKYY